MKSEHGLNGLRRLTQIKIREIREILLNLRSPLPNSIFSGDEEIGEHFAFAFNFNDAALLKNVFIF
ncbi:MAG: hypothetical protein RLZZ115_1344 [Cyanobacteriota bacterium]